MGQQRLNDFLLLHVHKEITDSLNLKEVLNNFANNEDRLQLLGKFSELSCYPIAIIYVAIIYIT